MVATGAKKLAGPLLGLQGIADTLVAVPVTSTFVNLTSAVCSAPAFGYIIYEGAESIPSMYTSQREWLLWIKDRFAGLNMINEPRTVEGKSVLHYIDYQPNLKWVWAPVSQSFSVL